MSVQRGDIVLAWFPFASGQGGKRRPCVIIQNDQDNTKIAGHHGFRGRENHERLNR